MAYLASTLFLDHNSELIVLVVNTLQRDLADDNVLVGAPPPRAPLRSGGATSVPHSGSMASAVTRS